MDNDIFIYPAERDWAGGGAVSARSGEAGAEEKRPAPIPRPEPVEPVRPEPIPRPEPVEPVRPAPIPRPEPVEPVRPAPIPRPYPTEPAFPLPLPQPLTSTVRFLNAAYGYGVLRVAVNRKIMATHLSYGTVSSFSRVNAGYQTVTVTNREGYVYLQKTVPFQMNTISTVAVIRTSSGLDLLFIPECGCRPTIGYGAFRVSNLAYGSAPMDTILADGRVIFGDVQYKETTSFKRIRPGDYQFYFAETALMPMPRSEDIESIDEGFSKFYPTADVMASLFVEAEAGYSYTALLLNGPRGSIQAMLLAEK